MTPIQELFDDTFTMLNAVATDPQKAVVFKTASREFFSYVYPIFFITFEQYNTVLLTVTEEELRTNYEDTTNIFNLSVGNIEIVELIKLTDCVAIRVKPLDYATFKLEDGYSGAYQYVVEYMLKKLERDNMSMLKSAGIEDNESLEVEDIATIRDYLKKEFGITTVGLVL